MQKSASASNMPCFSHALNQRSPAEGKGKGRKFLALGNTLGIKDIYTKDALQGQKLSDIFKAFALSGRYC